MMVVGNFKCACVSVVDGNRILSRHCTADLERKSSVNFITQLFVVAAPAAESVGTSDLVQLLPSYRDK